MVAGLAVFLLSAAPSPQTWVFNSLETIGGHRVTVSGNPKVVATEHGPAVAFDGNGDRLLIDHNPIGDAKAFTVEMVFKPAAGLNKTNDPRVLHIQDPNDAAGKRVMMEIRVNANDRWALDGVLVTDGGERILFDASKNHPCDEWAHAAVSFDGKTFKSFVNGREELRGDAAYRSTVIPPQAVVSAGSRINEKYWLLGLIKAVKVTRAAVDPEDFMPIAGDPSGIVAPRRKPGIPALAGPAVYTLTGRRRAAAAGGSGTVIHIGEAAVTPPVAAQPPYP